MLLADIPELLDGTGDVHYVSGVSWCRDHGVAVEQGVSEPGEIFGPCAATAMYSRAALVHCSTLIHEQPAAEFARPRELLSRSRRYAHRILSLPLFPESTPAHQDFFASLVVEFHAKR